jgi:hypothetical protein
LWSSSISAAAAAATAGIAAIATPAAISHQAQCGSHAKTKPWFFSSSSSFSSSPQHHNHIFKTQCRNLEKQ